jgi:two-component system NarL family sensor kinase
MSKRTASWLAWSMCALSLVLTALSLLLLGLILSYPGGLIFDHWLDGTLLAINLSTVGAVIASRNLPNNPIGWLLCTTGLLNAVNHFAAQYAIYTLLAAPGSLPAGYAAAWIFSWLPIPQLGLTAFVLLVFPNGRLPSPRWRWFFWLSLLQTLVATISQMFAPGPLFYLGGIYNPLGVGGLPNAFKLIETLLFALIFI